MFRARQAGNMLACLITAAVVAGCGTSGPGAAPPGQTGASERPSGSTSKPSSNNGADAGGDERGTEHVPEELRFTGTTLDGSAFSGEKSLAGKAAVLWFWAPWCPKCQAEAPTIAETARAHEDEVTFLGVASQDEVGNMREFVSDHGVGGFPHLRDTEAKVWTKFGVTHQPAYAFISPDGTVDVVKSQLSETELTNRVERLGGA